MQDIRKSFLWLALAWAAAVALLAITDVVVAEGQITAQGESSVEEIVVTAQKRSESLQDIPVSVSALTGEQLDQVGFANLNDIRTYVPNLTIRSNAGGNTGATVSIRGAITGDPIITFEPAVGIYQDGVYISKSVGSLFDAPDLERIEVLRGPQGTLYGRNTIGGAVNLIARKPQDDPEALVRLQGGNFDTFIGLLTLDSGKYDIGDGELLGRVGVRGNVQYRTRDGMYDNVVVDGAGVGDLGSSGFDDADRVAARIITRWEPRDFLKLDYTFEYFQAHEVPTAFQLSGVREGTPATAFFPGIENFVRKDRVNAIGNNRIMNPGEIASGIGSLDLRNDLLTHLHNITIAADFDGVPILGDIELKAISGWRSIRLAEVQDLDGTAMHLTDFQLYVDQEQFSQELQMVGTTLDGAIEYVAGVFYFEENGGENNPQIFFGGAPIAASRLSINGFDNDAIAPYGQITLTPHAEWFPGWLEFLHRTSITGGVRYTAETKRASRFTTERFPNARAEFDNVAPMANLAYSFTDEIMGYYRWARGYKSGGFNGRSPCDIGPNVGEAITCPDANDFPVFSQPFREEIMSSHEVGFKTDWFDRRLQVNATGFYQDIEDKQVSDFRADPQFGAVTFVNNADQEMWGAELEANAVPIDNLNLRLAYSLLRPEYTKFINLMGEDVADEAAFVNAPEHTISVGAAYSIETEHATFTLSGDGYWQDDEDFLIFDNDIIHAGDYFIANARLTVAEIALFQGHVDIGVWGRNLFDRKYRTFGIDFGPLVGVAGNNYGNRRTIGADLTWRWGAT